MWSSRIFSLVGRGRAPSAQSVISSTSRLRHRAFVAPAIASIDKGGFPTGQCSTTPSANTLNRSRPNIGLTSNSILQNIIALPFYETRRCMSKYLSKSATKRLPLNTKRAKKGYYKGKGGTKEGRITSKGKFIADPFRKLQLVVPDLDGFPLKPYIARSVSRTAPEKRTNAGQ
ncbi:hypothetical protein ACHAXR_004141 [Thalassiosira sp. AJA248-18]